MRDAALARPHLIAHLVPAPNTLRIDNTVQRLIAEGFVGEVLAVDVRQGGSFIDFESPLHWRQDTDVSGHNVLSLGILYEMPSES